jgi:hypothetical protein
MNRVISAIIHRAPAYGACFLLAIMAGGPLAAQTVVLTNSTLFRTDASGTNLASSGGVVAHGGWTTVLDQQSVPGTYGGELFLSAAANPGSTNFLTPAAVTWLALDPGAHTFYFWADGDDTQGGSAAFGLNLYLNGAGSASPAISAYVAPGLGQAINPDSSTTCTAGFDFKCVNGSGQLTASVGNLTVTLTDFRILGVGGGMASSSCVDLVNSSSTTPFAFPPQPNGICDTYGRFTITVTPKAYYFPHLALGGGWQTTLTYINPSAQAVTCVTSFFSNSGGQLPVPFSGGGAANRTDTLQAGQSLHDETKADSTMPTSEGWAQAMCNGPIKASLLFRFYQNGAAVSEAGVNASITPATKFVTYAETRTGVAYANPSTQAAQVTFTAVSSVGTKLGSTTITVAPGGHGSANLGPLLGMQNFAGFVEITSSVPIVSLSLNAEAFPAFSSLPPGDVSDSTPLVFQ